MTDKPLGEDYFLLTIDDPIQGKPVPTLSFTRSPLVMLGFTANRYARTTSRIFKKEFGLAAMDWRILVMLTWKTDIPASVACQTIGIDKAAVSRTLARLEKLGLVTANIFSEMGKRPVWRLTQKGYEMHDDMLKVSLLLHQKLTKGFSEQDVEKFNGYLELMMGNIEDLEEEM